MTTDLPPLTVVQCDSDETLYRTHIGAAIRFAYLLSGDQATAQDIAHDAFLRCAPKVGALRQGDRFGGYLRRAVLREALSRRRSAEREQRRIERFTQTQQLTAGEPPDRADLLDALGSLPERQRAALVLRYWNDLPEREIARLLRCRPGTVKSLLSRGLATLKMEIGDA